MELIESFANALSMPKVVVVLLIAIAAHLLARLLSGLSVFLSGLMPRRSFAKFQTVNTLAAGIAIFAVYFIATGAILPILETTPC